MGGPALEFHTFWNFWFQCNGGQCKKTGLEGQSRGGVRRECIVSRWFLDGTKVEQRKLYREYIRDRAILLCVRAGGALRRA